MMSHVELDALDRSVRAFVFAAGITVVNETRLVDWLNHIDQSVVNNSIAKRSRTDNARFRFANSKVAIRPR